MQASKLGANCDVICTWPAIYGYVKPQDLYEYSGFIAMSVLMELWTVWLVVLFYYEAKNINKLTFKPFKIAALYFFFKILRLTYEIYYQGKTACLVSCDNEKAGLKLRIGSYIFGTMELVTFFCFFRNMIQEQRILNFFIYVQASTPYEQLDQKRMKYNQEERRFARRDCF